MPSSILDCTLRDGGYYNDWDFPLDLVERYVAAMSALGVDWVEMGFRQSHVDGFAGRFAYCRDSLLAALLADSPLGVAVMVDGKNFLGAGAADELATLFAPADDSPVGLIRITATTDTLAGVLNVQPVLGDLGYRVSINLMRASMLADRELSEAAAAVSGSGVEYLYIADSFGGMLPEGVRRKIGIIKDCFDGRAGFHPHDNMGLALANTLAAIEAGADIVDGSVLGMGRGAGNLRTEQLVLLTDGRNARRLDPLFELVTAEFAQLQDRYGWGSSLPYMLSAVYDVHPMYAQSLLGVPRYTPMEVIRALEGVRDSGAGASFSPVGLDGALEAVRKSPGPGTIPVRELPSDHGDGDFEAWGSRPVLIVGAGPTVQERATDIEAFAVSSGALVVECNIQDALGSLDRHLRVFLNQHRLRQAGVDAGARGGAVLGMRHVPEAATRWFTHADTWHWPCEVVPGQFAVHHDRCVIPHPVVGMYAIALALRSGAREIYLVGFDGYIQHDAQATRLYRPEQVQSEREMEEFVALLMAYESVKSGDVRVRSLTPTLYDFEVDSIYNHV